MIDEESFNFIAKILLLILGTGFIVFFKPIGVRAIRDRSKLLEFFHLKMAASKEVNIKIAQAINLIVGTVLVVTSVLSLFYQN